LKEIEESSFVSTEEINPHLTAKIDASYVRHHRLVPDQLADLITSVHRAIGQVGQPPQLEEVFTPAVSVRRSVHRDHVICLVWIPGEDAAAAHQHAPRLEPR
jgi:predicted transcriptional regulator